MTYIHPDKTSEYHVLFSVKLNLMHTLNLVLSYVLQWSVYWILIRKTTNEWDVGEAIMLANISEVLGYTKYLKVL